MIDPEIEKYLALIHGSVKQLKVGPGRALLNGVLNGFGYVIGFGLAIIMVGYVLNIVGVIPAFRDQVMQWRQLLEKTGGSEAAVPIKNTR